MTTTPPAADTTNDEGRLHAVRESAEKTLDSARQSASHAYERARESTKNAGRKAGKGIEANPLAVLAGGLAVGIAAGMALPRHPKEKELLEPLGTRLADSAAAAAKAARDAGKAEIDALLPEKGVARDQVTKLVSNVFDAAKDATKR